MRPELYEVLLRHDEVADLDPAARRLAVRDALLEDGFADIPGALDEVARYVDGFGPLNDLMGAPDVTDILINGPTEVWIERAGNLERTEVRFDSGEELGEFVERLLSRAGAHADASCPIADARLPGGSRMHVVVPPLAPTGPLVSIRRFPDVGLSLDDLICSGGMSEGQGNSLRRAVQERRSIVISGATGTGKTTLLGALLGCIGLDERVITIEEIPEVASGAPHVASLVARRANLEGRGEVTLEELARAALRMRPDRIVVGEVRGPEALIALRAMGSGHSGSMLTVHAASPKGALDRLVSLALSGAPNLSEGSLRAELCESVEIVVHLERRDGRRTVSEILWV